ncbi:MAG: response regulator, partial [Alphaproteobacteria bacterium]
MLVDDSAVIRGFLQRTLEHDPEIEVVVSVGDGQMAINALSRHEVEIIVLDIDMPVMDGLTALPRLLETDPSLQVIVASTLTQRNARISIEALSKGAADYLTKPTSARELGSASDVFNRELI